MILFIASEVMFFVAWFWAYFDAALFPAAVSIDFTAPDGTVESSKEIIAMVHHAGVRDNATQVRGKSVRAADSQRGAL
jgi:cytochrome c oxidase subunit III